MGQFFSDNAAPVDDLVLQAMIAANGVDSAYDADALSRALDHAFSELFATDVVVLALTTGTAANALALSVLCPPFGGILCHEEAHIVVDECGAPSFFTHGAQLIGCAGVGAKLSPETISERLTAIRPDVHQVQAHALSITQATEYGQIYQVEEVKAIGSLCQERGIGLHMDGARFANAVATLGCHPADITWRAGVDALSFDMTKNGAMMAEALVLFDARYAEEARRRRKRGGHLLSKGRFVAAQLLAMLGEDHWIGNARQANQAAGVIAEAAGAGRLLFPVEANELFVRVTADEAATLRSAGFEFYDWGHGLVRLVTSWHHDVATVTPLAHAIAALGPYRIEDDAE